MTIEGKTYKRRRKLYKRHTDAGKPKVWKLRAKSFWWTDEEDFDHGAYETWGEAEVSRRAYWDAQA